MFALVIWPDMVISTSYPLPAGEQESGSAGKKSSTSAGELPETHPPARSHQPAPDATTHFFCCRSVVMCEICVCYDD